MGELNRVSPHQVERRAASGNASDSWWASLRRGQGCLPLPDRCADLIGDRCQLQLIAAVLTLEQRRLAGRGLEHRTAEPIRPASP